MLFPGRRPGDRDSGGSIQRVDLDTGKVETCTRSATADGEHRCARPTTSCSTPPAASGSPTTACATGRSATAPASTTRRPTARRSARSSTRSTRRTASACRPTATVYLAETYTGRVWAWDVPAPGSAQGAAPSRRRQLLAGLAGLPAARLAGRRRRRQRVRGDDHQRRHHVIAPDGTIVEHIATGDPITTNICFGGPDRRTAYITLSGTGRLVATQWPRPGLELAYHA